ncbi:MAG: M3 family metallopeptidase, partial [Treponema sp.]|nr:M3 family metallopeptidase [Treponema sp.]
MSDNENTIPPRSEISINDTWDLSKLFKNDDEWNSVLAKFIKDSEKIPSFQGTLKTSAESLAGYLDFSRDLTIMGERLGYYAMLRTSEDEGSSVSRAMMGKITMAGAKAEAAAAWAKPEILSIPEKDIEAFLLNNRLKDYKIYLQRIIRYKPHILSDKEEKIISQFSENDEAASDAFSVLTNVDINFGTIDTPEGKRPLSQSTYSVFMESGDREIRKQAYNKLYGCYEEHKTTLASLYSSSVKKDAILARIRRYSSSRSGALFSDNVSETVYDNLINAVSGKLPALHKYYALRKRALKLDELRHYDVYTSIVPNIEKKTTWNEAVELISSALSPLGDEYVSVLRGGLLNRWADRYENKGKSSGAFSAGSFTGDPYILMNYKDDSIRDVFTLAHEGGHSMHSWYSARSNPFMHYN